MASFNSVLQYYEQHEPSSPVRVLTATAKEFVNKSFFEVIQAMAPGGHSDLAAMLSHLQEKPLAALLSDSYTRHLSGESLLTMPETSSAITDQTIDQPIVTNEDTGNSQSMTVISSRKQVLEALQDIEIYFTNAEPSSPIPLIVADIKQLVPKRFMDLIGDLSRALPHSKIDVSE